MKQKIIYLLSLLVLSSMIWAAPVKENEQTANPKKKNVLRDTEEMRIEVEKRVPDNSIFLQRTKKVPGDTLKVFFKKKFIKTYKLLY